MNKEELRKLFDDFCKDKEFELNPNGKVVNKLLNGVLENEKRLGLKYCPCRITNDNFEDNLELICPCNFFVHETWLSKNMCWCSLFVKRKS